MMFWTNTITNFKNRKWIRNKCTKCAFTNDIFPFLAFTYFSLSLSKLYGSQLLLLFISWQVNFPLKKLKLNLFHNFTGLRRLLYPSICFGKILASLRPGTKDFIFFKKSFIFAQINFHLLFHFCVSLKSLLYPKDFFHWSLLTN